MQAYEWAPNPSLLHPPSRLGVAADILPKVWVEPVNGVIPGNGYHIQWLGLWMEQAEGISLENVVRLGKPMMHPDELLKYMHEK